MKWYNWIGVAVLGGLVCGLFSIPFIMSGWRSGFLLLSYVGGIIAIEIAGLYLWTKP